MPSSPPDIVLLATEWRPRALLRAQLSEEGFEVQTVTRPIRLGSLVAAAARAIGKRGIG